MKIYYIYNKTEEKFVNKAVEYLLKKEVLFEKVEINDLDSIVIEENTHFLVTGQIYDIKTVLNIASSYGVSVGIIPLAKQKELMSTFNLSSNLEKSIDMALVPSEERIDLLYCDEEMVLQEVVIGDVPPLDCLPSSMDGTTFWQRIKSFFAIIKKVRHLKHTSFKITTSKEKILNFSAIGAVGVEYNNRTFASKLIHAHLKTNDGRWSTLTFSLVERSWVRCSQNFSPTLKESASAFVSSKTGVVLHLSLSIVTESSRVGSIKSLLLWMYPTEAGMFFGVCLRICVPKIYCMYCNIQAGESMTKESLPSLVLR